ncbi:MAG: DNA recombination protein RmuC [Alphaproteobacteria bacterium]
MIVLAAAAIVVFALVLSRRGSGGEVRLGELAGRLSQMAEAHAAAQAQLAERLQAQERALSKAVGEALQKTSQEQRTTLDELKERLVKIDAAQRNITELSTQVVGLQDILANKQARGAFGEVQLRDLVESVLPPSAYLFQATVGGNRRADCMLKLPNPPGPICIDAKFPLESYRALRNAGDEGARKLAARSFASDVVRHVRDIAEKYIVEGETAEAALMFLPSEAVYAELHANFGDVVEKSYRARVFIVSPTTLWATLNTVRAVMKDVRMKEAAGVIQKEVMTLLDDVERLERRVDKLQQHFAQANVDLKKIQTSTRKITRRGERIQELQLEEPDQEEPREIGELPPGVTPIASGNNRSLL